MTINQRNSLDTLVVHFTARRYADNAVQRTLLSAGVSVHMSRSCIVSRRLKISSNFFLGPAAQ